MTPSAITISHELWKDIPGYENVYQISNLGRVRRISILNTSIGNIGYRVVQCSVKRSKRQFLLHRLLAKMWLPQDPNPLRNCVNHKDCNRLNNALDNLEWVTVQENLDHAQRMGRLKRTTPYTIAHRGKISAANKGRPSTSRKLTFDQATRIRTQASIGKTCTSLAKEYRVSKKTILNIIHHRRYLR